MKNGQKGKKITRLIEAKPLSVFQKTQNQAYLKTPNNKTKRLQTKNPEKCPFYKTNYYAIFS